MRKSNIMQLLEKYGKDYYDAPSSKNMARAIVVRLQAKIWQDLLRWGLSSFMKNTRDNKLITLQIVL